MGQQHYHCETISKTSFSKYASETDAMNMHLITEYKKLTSHWIHSQDNSQRTSEVEISNMWFDPLDENKTSTNLMIQENSK